MDETPPAAPPTEPQPEGERTATSRTIRCPICGYNLAGLYIRGTCPECGNDYGPEKFLKPWPSAGEICLRLGWPLIGAGIAMWLLSIPELALFGLLGLYGMLVVIPVNSYFYVRALLRASLPHNTRTRGPVAVFRALGTALCLVMFLVFVGFPVACIGLCLASGW